MKPVAKSLCLVLAAALLAGAAGCKDKDRSKSTFITVTVLYASDESPVDGVTVTCEDTGLSNVSDSSGQVMMDNVSTPYTITLDAPGETPLTVYGIADRTITLYAGTAGTPTHTAHVTVTGVDCNSIIPGMGDDSGILLASDISTFTDMGGGLANYSVTGTSTVPDPVPATVVADRPVVIGTLVQCGLGIPTKYGYTLVAGGITAENQSVTVNAESFLFPLPDIFNGELDTSGLSHMSPDGGMLACFANIDGYDPWINGFGAVYTGADTYNGTILDVSEASEYMAAFLLTDNASGSSSGRIIRGSPSQFGDGLWSFNVDFMDVAAVAEPANGSGVSSTTPALSWTMPRSDAIIMVQIEGPASYEWTGIVINGASGLQVPATHPLESGSAYTWTVTAVVIPGFDISQFKMSALWNELSHISIGPELTFTVN